MKIILIILLGVCLFAYFSIRKATLNPGTEERECQDKEKYKELLKKEKLEEVFATLDIAQGDINNIKIIKDYYKIDLKTAKELWDSIRDQKER